MVVDSTQNMFTFTQNK